MYNDFIKEICDKCTFVNSEIIMEDGGRKPYYILSCGYSKDGKFVFGDIISAKLIDVLKINIYNCVTFGDPQACNNSDLVPVRNENIAKAFVPYESFKDKLYEIFRITPVAINIGYNNDQRFMLMLFSETKYPGFWKVNEKMYVKMLDRQPTVTSEAMNLLALAFLSIRSDKNATPYPFELFCSNSNLDISTVDEIRDDSITVNSINYTIKDMKAYLYKNEVYLDPVITSCLLRYIKPQNIIYVDSSNNISNTVQYSNRFKKSISFSEMSVLVEPLAITPSYIAVRYLNDYKFTCSVYSSYNKVGDMNEIGKSGVYSREYKGLCTNNGDAANICALMVLKELKRREDGR